jgi:hypothetical protein
MRFPQQFDRRRPNRTGCGEAQQVVLQSALSALTTLVTDSFASPNSNVVFGW